MPSDTRQAILTAALDAFDRLGFDHATVAQVREDAGVSNGSFFHFFGSKDALAAALFLQSLQDYHAAMVRALEASPSAADGIAQLVQRHVEWVVAQRPQARFLFEQARADWLAFARTDQEASNAAFRAAIDDWRQPLVDSGQLLPVPVPVFMAQLIGPAQILCRAWLSGRQPTSPVVHTAELVACASRAPAGNVNIFPKEADMIIDAWAQHPTLRHSQDEIFASLRRWTRREVPTEPIPMSSTLAAMDAGGVDRTLISAWYAPRNVMISNDEVADFVAQAPDRLVGVGSVDISKPMQAVREIRRCVQELGFKAIRVLPWLWKVPPTDRRFYPVYVACCELGVPFCTQIGHTGPLMPSEVGRPVYLDRVALDFPELRIVGGHIGYPWTDEAIALVTKHENVYIDTSAYTARRYPPALVEFMRGNGRSKVMFGTNYPMILPAKALEGLDALGLDAVTRDLFLAGNARRVFNL